jgi:hypothetical protein
MCYKEKGKLRYQFIDFVVLKKYTGFDRLWWKECYPAMMQEKLQRKIKRDPLWTKNIVVGREAFVTQLKTVLKKRITRKSVQLSIGHSA